MRDARADPTSPAGRLRALKERIRRETPGRVRDYTLRGDAGTQALAGLDDLDAMVARDLWSDLHTETATYLRQAPRTWQEADPSNAGWQRDLFVSHMKMADMAERYWGQSYSLTFIGGKTQRIGLTP